jgi:ligand-binding sensor domain-containing protein
MRYGFLITIIFLASGFSEPTQAQQQLFKNYTMNDGLVSSSICRIFQDSKGFLWIGTWEGLSKYDGNTFTNYTTSNGLSHNLVNDFYESKDEKLYVALNNGAIDVIKNNSIVSNSKPSLIVVNRFMSSAAHKTIATTDRHGIIEFYGGNAKQPIQTFPTHAYQDLAWVNDSILVVLSDSAITALNRQYEKVAEIKQPTGIYNSAKIYQDSKKRIWVGTSSGLNLIADLPKQNLPITFTGLPAIFNMPELTKGKITDILEDTDGNLWMGTYAGLVKINADGSRQLITVKDGLVSNIVTTLFEDKEKNIWVGTAAGLSKLVTRAGIRLYAMETGVWFSDNLYLLFPFKKNNLLVSTNSGAQVFSKITGRFSPVAGGKNYFTHSAARYSEVPLLAGFATIAEFDTAALSCKNVKQLPVQGCSRMVKDKNSHYFLSDLHHLFFSNGNGNQKILDYRISSLLIDKAGDLWAGTWQNGIFKIKYQYENNRLSIISTRHFLPTENIRSLMEDSKGNIWAGTRYNGVFLFEKKEDGVFSVSNFNQRKGLSSNFIKEIKEDAKGNFWVAFYQGLDKLIPSKTGFRIFNFSRVNNYFTSIVGLALDEDRSLWLATREGLVQIKDGEMENLPPLPTYITRISAKDSLYSLSTNQLQLNHRQNQIQFEFSSPGFLNEKQVLYSYRLFGGPAGEWTAAGNQHVVSFASLKPGNYVFEARSLGWNGEWGKPAKFDFVISPPFWQTAWFVLLAGAATISLGWWLFKRRIKTIRHETEMKQKIAETEMMALRAQMNPHFIFNCLNSIDNLIQMDEKEKATLYLSKFAKLIRSILENSVNNLVPCWKDMDTLQLYLELEALRFDHKFSYKVEADSEILNGDYKVPPLVIQPFVENAIHHGLLNKISGDKKLFIKVFVTDSHIHYIVQDNGIGRKKAATYKQQNKLSYGSMGIQITEERINIFNQAGNGSVIITDLHDEFNEPSGTKVEVSLIIQP